METKPDLKMEIKQEPIDSDQDLESYQVNSLSQTTYNLQQDFQVSLSQKNLFL